MYKKKLITLALATLLPMSSVLMAEDTATEPAAQPAAVAASEPEAAPEAKPEEKPAASPEKSAAESTDYGRMTMQERWKAREKRYEELKKRAEEAGVMLPDSPPWKDREAMMARSPEMQKRMEHMKKMQAMTPEERDAYRMERYEEMRERAAEIGMELPENPPWKDRQTMMDEEWAKQREIINNMTDEERAACHAMHRRHMMEMGPGPMRRGPGMYPPAPAYDAPARGYGGGYGPYPYGPRGNYWEPNQ
jgi:pyruvate/2-oxoglutarate dehydrogenase complex dihydrolipoamide acyltransferase (E2) component